MSRVFDYSWARPDPKKMRDAGVTGVMRYLSPNSGKNLEPGERDRLRAAGLDIGLVWEWYAQRPKEGRQAGVNDATAALAQANALGFPGNKPIYFAVDWDATPGDQGPINEYFKGVASVIGLGRTGVYAGYYPLKRLFDAGLVKYGWQTYAWSGGQWDDRAQLRQVLNGQWGGSVDYNDTHGDYGAWEAGQAPQPGPTPAPVPAPGGTHKYTIKSGDTFWGLEAKNGWPHGTLQGLNPGVVPERLQIGQEINVPGGGGGPAPQPAPSGGKYTIKSGDTFWGLEAKNGWPHGTLQGLNPGVNPTTLQIGQVIRVPGGGGGDPEPKPAQNRKYTIRSGDTFWGLEARNGWAHGTLQAMNPGVEPTRLQIGQQINVPA